MLDDKPDQCDSTFPCYQEPGPKFPSLNPLQDSQLPYRFCLKASFKDRVNVLGCWLVVLLEARVSTNLVLVFVFLKPELRQSPPSLYIYIYNFFRKLPVLCLPCAPASCCPWL